MDGLLTKVIDPVQEQEEIMLNIFEKCANPNSPSEKTEEQIFHSYLFKNVEYLKGKGF